MLLPGVIAAVATGPGFARWAVVRLSGQGTLDTLARILASPRPAPAAPGVHRVRVALPPPAHHARLLPPRPELPALLALFRAPRSYTGDDAAELFVPGSPHVTGRVLSALFAAGARPAQPGEFTARAFLAGRLTAEQAEGVQALVAARTQAELDAAGRLLSGSTGARFRTLADDLAATLALVEAGIDFADQDDVVAIGPAALLARLDAILAETDALLGPGAAEAHDHRPAIALVGPPNAGKSTLFNALLARPRVVVSPEPGTTRDSISETIAIPGGQATLTDLAGLDDAIAARSRLDAAGQAAARRAIDAADVLIYCDPDARFEGPAFPDPGPRPVIRLRTKADLPGGPPAPLAVCALDGWGLDALRRAIADAADLARGRAHAEHLVIPRHRRALADARAALADARAETAPLAGSRQLTNAERVAAPLRDALDHLAELAGRISPDDVIGRIFATFCIGK
ncbi:MAG: 50S ribosome-binding GTPase [Phycisphaerales bacterium]|nr:50S ribosome-binding GTPase [Phycisphaerales bacterium]